MTDGFNCNLQRVPATKDLPAIASAMLVKPLAPALDASSEGLFTTVIPDGRSVLQQCSHSPLTAAGPCGVS